MYTNTRKDTKLLDKGKGQQRADSNSTPLATSIATEQIYLGLPPTYLDLELATRGQQLAIKNSKSTRKAYLLGIDKESDDYNDYI